MKKPLNDYIILAYNQGYRVTPEGLVTRNGSPIKPKTDGTYFKITIRSSSTETRTIKVHRLQAYQKYGDKMFQEGIQVRHFNGNSFDNSEDNILIGTCSQNQFDKSKEVRVKMAIHASSKRRVFTDEQVKRIHEDHSSGMSYNKLVKKYNTSKGTLSYLFNKASFRIVSSQGLEP